jgi:solute carrier family 12 sodium/potassium/chloride transporter 2
VDFANLITKRHSLLECIHIVKDTMDWKTMESIQANGVQWLRSNHIKAFYKVSRHSDFHSGARASLEMSGLGKLKPNMVMVGFKEDWRQSPNEARDYFRVLQVAFEMRLSVGVLRLSGGLDISGQGPTDIFTIKRFTSQTSVDSGVDDKDSSNSPPSSSYSPQPELKQGRRFRLPANILERVKGGQKPQDPTVLTTGNGNEINDAGVVKTMTQFKGIDKVDGFIDIYWLYDDGGLTLLLPYILTTRKKFQNAHMRIFILASDKDINEDLNSMEEMLFRLRINCHQITVLSEADQYPGKATRDEFSSMIAPFTDPDNDSPLLTDTDLKNNNDRTVFHLRLAEIVRDRSKDSLLVIMTLPLPKKDDSIPYPLYLAWLDMLTIRMPPFLLVRGNQDSVLSIYL